MLTLAYILTGVAFAFVLISLVMGGASMQSRKDGAREKSNKWMQRRVFSQAFAVLMLAFLLYAKNRAKGG